MFEQVVLDHVSVLFVEFVGVIVIAEFQAGGIGDGSHLVEIFAGSFQIGFRLPEIDARQYDVLAADGSLRVASLLPPVFPSGVVSAAEVRSGDPDADVFGHLAEFGGRAAVEFTVSV